MDPGTAVTRVGDAMDDEKAGHVHAAQEVSHHAETASSDASTSRSDHVPMKMKLFAVLLVTAIGFGSHWSGGVTGAMKSTLKKA